MDLSTFMLYICIYTSDYMEYVVTLCMYKLTHVHRVGT